MQYMIIILAQDPCAEVTCSNKGSCIENSAYSRGYWCECDEGWAGQDCKHRKSAIRIWHCTVVPCSLFKVVGSCQMALPTPPDQACISVH